MFISSSIILLSISAFAWEIDTPEHLGMDQEKLEEAKEYALTGGGSGCIIRGGKMVMSWGDQQQKYDIYSSTKSIGGIALALAIMDGKVSLDDKMVDHLSNAGVPPEHNRDTGWLEEITLLHLATHTAGFEKTRGWAELRFRPGTGWLYSDGGTNWLADCLTVAYGRDLLDLMTERVFAPLGITVGDDRNGDEDLHWGFNNLDRPKKLNGIPRRPFNAGIHANVQVMAKFGYLYLKRGYWGGQQIISESLIDIARTTVPSVVGFPVKEDEYNRFAGASDHYGILWWNNADGALAGVPRDAYWSWGLKESLIVVIPSLDLVIARAGKDGWQDNRWGSGYPVIEPFIRAICESVAECGTQPYPQSTYISGITFDNLILDKDANGPDYASGDQWAGTWADDGHMYMGWGDGTGFGHRGGWRDRWTSYMGLARIEGMPPNHQGFNVWSGYEPESQAEALYVNQKPQPLNLKPGDGLIFLNGTMYWYAERKSDGRLDCQLWTSTDYGRNWKDHGRFFQEDGKFAFTGIIQFGQNYSDFPDDLGQYLYMFDGGTKNEDHPHYSRKGMLLARIPLDDLLNREAVEFFDGTPDNPSWTSHIEQAKQVFEDPNGVNAQVSCTYNKAIGRYILLTTHKVLGVKEGFGIFESEKPWGPWRTVYYTNNLDEFIPGLDVFINVSLPSKWISRDGKTFWLVFSGRPSDPMYSFNLIQAKLDVGIKAKMTRNGVDTMDPRWRDLPHTDTEFVPEHYHDQEEWERRRDHLRKQILWAAGLWPMPEKTPLNPIISGRITHDDYTIEKVCFESYPGFYVCGNLYRPRNTTLVGHPAVLNPHGHAATGRLHDNEVASYQARCITFARMGCVAFMWDMVDYNDSARQLSGHYEDETYWSIHNEHWKHDRDQKSLWNIGSFGLQLWNSIRTLDFLSSLPEVDIDRLACTGESGGGTQTFMLYAVDDRLKVAAPVCMVSSCMQGGCNCENAPLLRIDTHNTEIGAMMAPKPLMLVSVTGDWTSHTPDVEYPAIRSVYELYRATDKLKNVHFEANHGYNLDMREAVYPWFAKWLSLPYDESFKEPAYQTESDEDILSFTEKLPEGAVDGHEKLIRQLIDDTEGILASYKPTDLQKYSENHRVLGEGLRLSVGARPFGAGDVEYRHRKSADLNGVPCEEGILVGKKRGVRVPVWMFRPESAKSGANALLVHGKGKSAILDQMDLINELLASGQTVYAIDVFGIGDAVDEQNPEEPRGSTRYFNTFNRTDDAERVYDIVLTISYCLRSHPTEGNALNVAGFEEAGPWVMTAGAIMGQRDPNLPEIRFAIDTNQFDTSSEETYLQKLYIPGIMRAGGLRNAAALLAPGDLLLHNTGDLFDTSWLEDAYGLRHPDWAEPLLIVKEREQDDTALVEFLIK